MSQWTAVGHVDEITPMRARVIETPHGDVAIFRTRDDQFFALRDKCPHKGGALSQGIVHGTAVTCPLHNWVISLESGEAQGFDTGCTKTFSVKREGDELFVALSADVAAEA